MKTRDLDDALINQRMIIEELLKRVAMLEKAPFDGVAYEVPCELRIENIPSHSSSI